MKITTDQRNNVLLYFITIIVSLVIGYISFGNSFHLDTYKEFFGDYISMAAGIKSIQENGISGIWFNPRTGAPETAALIEGSAVDIVMALSLWGISIFVKSTPRIQYLYYIITFALNAFSMLLLLRKLKINAAGSFVFSILFTTIPYHFYRGLGHLVLTNYMYFAITVYLSLHILGIIEEEKKDRWKIWVCCILLGFGFGYYYAFGLIVLAIAYLLSFIVSEKKLEIAKKMWIAAVVLSTIFVSMLPQIIYSFLNGKNPYAMKREFWEQEIYGLKIIQLLLPQDYSRFSVFRAWNQEYSSHAPLVNENAVASLGIIASVGFLLLCGMLIYSFASRKKRDGKEQLFIDFLSFSTLTLILVGSIGGFGEIFNYFVTAQIRCYNRVSIYIAGFSLIMLAILFNKWKIRKQWICYVIYGVVLTVGLVDQVRFLDDHWQQAVSDTQKIYEDFFAKVEDQLEEEAMVYQLPYLDYPEAGPFDYKHFTAYLLTDTLRWSYGGVRGRNLAAQKLNIDQGASYRFLMNIKEAGFSAVYIDVDGYEDDGKQILSFYDSLHIEPIVSQDQMLYLYDISNLQIPDHVTAVGYTFVDTWCSTYNLDMTAAKKEEVANGLNKMDTNAYLELYSGIVHSDIVQDYTDEEYIDFLYLSLLGRKEDDSERQSWMLAIQNGSSRKELFNNFLSSKEFRERQAFEDVSE